MDIIILTASFGLGHNSVANAIKSQIAELDSNIETTVKDVLDFTNPFMNKTSVWFYKTLTKYSPNLYNFFYNQKNTQRKILYEEFYYQATYNKIKKYINELSPKLVISTFPMCSTIVSRIKSKCKLDIPLITVITDVVDSWEWIADKTDMYFAPAEIVADKLINKGIDKKCIKITGIPVRKEFLLDNDNNDKKKQVLIMGSAMGKLAINQKMLNELEKSDNVNYIIVTGSNEELYNRLTGKTYKNIKIVGYTNEIAKLMDESSIIVTKPGGVTLFESINKCVPMIIKKSNVGQEKYNVEFIEETGIGLIIDKNNKFVDMLSNIVNNPQLLDNIKNNMRRVKKQISPQKVGEYALRLIM